MTTHRLLGNGRFEICVPASQADEYRAVTNRLIVHPDNVKGLTPKLNWIFEHVDAETLVLLDDDLECLVRCFAGKGEQATIREPELVHAIIEHTAQLAEDAGIFMFGWEASNGAIRFHSGLRPFMLTGYINGCAMGFRRGHGLRFDPRIVAKNDFDISAMNAWKHRRCLKNTRYVFQQKGTFVGAGGQSEHRNSETESQDLQLLRKKWGTDTFRRGGHTSSRKRDYAGIEKITMHLPF